MTLAFPHTRKSCFHIVPSSSTAYNARPKRFRHVVVYCFHSLLTGTDEYTINSKSIQILAFRTCSISYLPLVKRLLNNRK